MTTLIEQAKQSKRQTIHEITPEIVELALAWANNEVTITQVKKVLRIDSNNLAYSILARALKEHLKPNITGAREKIEQKIKPEIEKPKKIAQDVSSIAPSRY